MPAYIFSRAGMGFGSVLDRFYAEDTGYVYARIKENLIGLKGYLRLKR